MRTKTVRCNPDAEAVNFCQYVHKENPLRGVTSRIPSFGHWTTALSSISAVRVRLVTDLMASLSPRGLSGSQPGPWGPMQS